MDYACHEGNRAMANILSAARADEKAVEEASEEGNQEINTREIPTEAEERAVASSHPGATCESSASSTCSVAAPCTRAPERAIDMRRCRSCRPANRRRQCAGRWREVYTDVLGISEIYAADLDAILDQRPQEEITRRLASLKAPLWLDAGVRAVDDARRAIDLGASRVIVGLETLPSFDVLSDICADGWKRSRGVQPRPARRSADGRQAEHAPTTRERQRRSPASPSPRERAR